MLNRKYHFIISLIFCFIFQANGSPILAQESNNKRSLGNFSNQNETESDHNILKVENKGLPHKILDLSDDGVSGICPQQRNTPQAPEPFLGMTNPLDSTPQNLKAGETLFKIDARPTACKVCHGFGGNGLGIIFERLQPKPRNFTCYYTMEDIPDGQIYWIIKNGSPGTPMPSFGALSDQQVWQLVLFIRQFAKKEIHK